MPPIYFIVFTNSANVHQATPQIVMKLTFIRCSNIQHSNHPSGHPYTNQMDRLRCPHFLRMILLASDTIKMIRQQIPNFEYV